MGFFFMEVGSVVQRAMDRNHPRRGERSECAFLFSLFLEDGEIPICSAMENGNAINLIPYRSVPIRNGTENGEIPIRPSLFLYRFLE